VLPQCSGGFADGGAVAPDGERVFVVGGAASGVWSLRAGSRVATVSVPSSFGWAEWNRGGGLVAALHGEGLPDVFEVFDASTGRSIGRQSVGRGSPVSVSFSPDGARALYAGGAAEPSLVVVDTATGARASADTPIGTDFGVRWASSSSAFLINALYDAETLKVRMKLPTLNLPALAVARAGDRLASVDDRGQVRVALASTGKVERTFDAAKGVRLAVPGDQSEDARAPVPVWGLTFSDDGRSLFAALGDGRVRRFDVKTGRLDQELRVGSGAFLDDPAQRTFESESRSLHASPSGRFIVLFDAYGAVELLDTTSSKRTVLGEAGDVTTLGSVAPPVFSADEAWLHVGRGGALFVPATGARARETGIIGEATFSSSGAVVVGGRADGTGVRLMRLADGVFVDVAIGTEGATAAMVVRGPSGLYAGPVGLASCADGTDAPGRPIELAPSLLSDFWAGAPLANRCDPLTAP
jgi:WD40 repeat protein